MILHVDQEKGQFKVQEDHGQTTLEVEEEKDAKKEEKEALLKKES